MNCQMDCAAQSTHRLANNRFVTQYKYQRLLCSEVNCGSLIYCKTFIKRVSLLQCTDLPTISAVSPVQWSITMHAHQHQTKKWLDNNRANEQNYETLYVMAFVCPLNMSWYVHTKCTHNAGIRIHKYHSEFL